MIWTWLDIAAVPDRFEDRVGEAQREHVLDGFFAHVVVDPEDLVLVEAGVQGLVEADGALEVPAEGLLDHEPGELSALARLVETVAGETLGDLAEKRRDGGKVVEPVARRAAATAGGVSSSVRTWVDL